MRKNSFITVTDQFCGAGGSSQGVRRLSQKNGGGIEVKLALNHWKLAIETHNTNFPDTLHDCTDISACDPRRYQSTDILITSPECTNHSLAKGKKIVQKQLDLFDSGKEDAAAERSRATMWDVCRFAEFHNYNAIVVENVVDARKWIMFDAWLQAMHALGYKHKCVYLNSMHCHPTPQSRDRMYVVFWKKGNKAPLLDYTPLAYCNKCEKNVNAIQTWKNPLKQFGKYKQQYVYCCGTCTSTVEPYYYAAFNCIDWSDIGTRIGDRKKELSANTVRRIEYGLKKYSKESFIIQTVNGNEHKHRSKSILDASFTHTTLQSQGIVNPLLIDDKQNTGINHRVRCATNTTNTIHTDARLKIVTPFVVLNEHSKTTPQTKKINEVFQTQATRQTMGLVTLFIIEMNKTGECKPASNSASTITAGGINHAILNTPFLVESKGQSKAREITAPAACQTSKSYIGLVTNEAWNSFIHYHYGQTTLSRINDALGTATCKERHSIVNYKEPVLEDCYYRMLKAHEIKLAMAFDEDYIILGSGKDQVKQCGNAVTPPAMEWLIERVVESLN